MRIKSKKNFCRKAACLILTGAMCATFGAGQFTAFAGSSVGTTADSSGTTSSSLNFKNANGTVNLTEVAFSNFSDKVFDVGSSTYSSTTQTVIVGLDVASVIEGGDIDKINAQQKSFLKALSANGIDYELKYSYNNAMSGVAITVPLGSLATIMSIDGVSSVSLSTTYYRPTEVDESSSGQTNYSKIYANGIYDSSEYVAQGIDGMGMTVAVLDTGLDYTHDAFNPENMIEQYPSGGMSLDTVRETFENKELMAEKLSGSSAEDVYVNQKVPFAYDYADHDADVYASYSQHGTHVAGIVAGKTDEHYTDKDGNDSGNSFIGVAPEAQLVICKVFTDNLDSPDIGGAKSEDIMAALDDCVALGVDVINMSLGTSAGFSSEALRISENIKGIDTEGEELNRVFENIRNSGISLMVAASNDFSAGYGSQFGTNLASNPDSGTVGSPSTYDGAMSVASVNGQMANYMLANATVDANQNVSGGSAIYYEESRNEDSDAYNFLDDMLGKVGEEGSVNSATFKYVVVPGYGDSTDYTTSVRRALADKQEGEKVIAIVKRGGNGLTFKKKIQTAKSRGADAVIVYNNVSGMIRMSLEDLENRIPAVSVSLDAGELLINGATQSVGYITLSRDFEAGPFMNDYSSWGVTPDLQLKPDITSHGGEIISTVAGGYAEMSGTSMACPNLAGFTALLKGYLKNNYATLWEGNNDTESAVNLANLTNNIMMSTATTVYDQNKLPYSPRKQGAGLATMDNVFSTQAYLYTKLTSNKNDPEYMCADGRPKAELGEDENKTGVYNIVFYVNNFGSTDLKFKTKSIFMTETLSKDGLSVAEKAYLFDSKGEWTVDGKSVAEGSEITVPAGTSNFKISVTLKLSASEKKYLDDTFKNGMFVEGFLQLESTTEGQCSLSLPFMGFYGDWEAAPLLDYDCFEIAAFDKNTSLTYETRPKESIWATQAYSYYWNEKYATPLGSFLYIQDPDKEYTSEWVYTEEEHVAISGFNEYYGESENSNYCTTTGIRALYAGLLRNAEIVTYTLTNVDTGEIIPDEYGNTVREIYRARKAHSSGGNAVPSQVLMEMRTEEMNFDGNGKYRLDYSFYFSSEDYANGVETDDTFSMTFYVDYEAPILEDARIRYVDIKDSSGKTSQKIYLDLDVFDNHYTQAIILCYSETANNDGTNIEALKLATEYITPVLNPKKNSTNTVSIEVTDFYEEYAGNLFVEVQDYAMNYNVYVIEPVHSEDALCPTDWTVSPTLSLEKNTTAKVTIDNIGSANASNFSWSSDNESIAIVKNGEVFGVAAGTTTINVSGGSKSSTITVTVSESNKTIKTPSISFGTMLNSDDNPVKAEGVVEVNPAQQISLSINVDPWYYPLDTLSFTWTSSNEELAVVEVDEYGNANVSVLYEGEDVKTVTITAQCNEFSSCKATVTLSVQDPFTVSGGTLTRYRGWGGELKDGVVIGGQVYNNVRVLTIPSDKAITSIGEEAFKDVKTVEVVVIPKLVTSIAQRAFKNCTNLKKICFISEQAQPIADSSLEMIYRTAFDGCTSLETVDLSNCKVITLDRNAFSGCTGLKEVIKMTAIGTAYDSAFEGCTSLEKADLSGLHMVGSSVFAGCTGLTSIKTGNFTAFGANMFRGCTSLKYDLETGAEGIVINNTAIPANAFYGCTALTDITFNAKDVNIGAYAFYGCSNLVGVTVASEASVAKVGDKAFGSCYNLNVPALQAQISGAEIGYDVFEMNTNVGEYIVDGKLVFAADTITDEDYLVNNNITEIGSYAFATSALSGITTLNLGGVTKIGKGAFYGLNLTSVTLPEGLTEIADYAFASSGLTAITIPASVKKIGNYAFYDCEDLTSLTFTQGGALEEIGNAAFASSAITGELVLPATVKKIGNLAFAQCNNITAVTINSVEVMGEGVFMNCTKLASAVFGDGALVTGTYTFYAYDENNYSKTQSSLTSVELGEMITKLDKGMFAFCDKLEEIDLKNVTVVGDEAFAGCSSLNTVSGIDRVTHFGKNAFAEAAFTSLNLEAAKTIEDRAFYTNASLARVTFSSALESIGNEAFAGSTLTSVAIPENCNSIGYSAFSGKASYSGTVVPCFSGYTVDENNTTYVAIEGVLYEYIGGKKDTGNTYSLIAFPDNKTVAQDADGNRTYTVIDDTISIGKYAFGSILSSRVNKVVFPYTLKTIGHGAFYGSGITTFEFHSINAPTLLEDLIKVNGVVQRPISNDYSMNSYFYLNFLGGMADYAPHYPGDTSYKANENTLIINYPENGKGYDNLVYSYYFGTSVKLEEMIEDDTRTLISMLEALTDASEIANWNTSNMSKAEVEEFSALVKQAHSYKNALSATQSAMVDELLFAKLSDVEAALKLVKKAFGIIVKIDGCAIAVGSSHKTEYRIGDTFSLDGLKIKVTYDDFSEEIVDAKGNFVLSESFDRPLQASDTSVTLLGVGDYAGATYTVRGLKVSESAPSVNDGSELPAWAIIVIVVGVAAVAAIAVVIIIFVKKSKKKSLTLSSETVGEEQTETSGEESAEDTEAASEEGTEESESQKETKGNDND
ncbi:MAG: leucine-rich repeat protein [Candidatus Coproplasma sp.]